MLYNRVGKAPWHYLSSVADVGWFLSTFTRNKQIVHIANMPLNSIIERILAIYLVPMLAADLSGYVLPTTDMIYEFQNALCKCKVCCPDGRLMSCHCYSHSELCQYEGNLWNGFAAKTMSSSFKTAKEEIWLETYWGHKVLLVCVTIWPVGKLLCWRCFWTASIWMWGVKSLIDSELASQLIMFWHLWQNCLLSSCASKWTQAVVGHFM